MKHVRKFLSLVTALVFMLCIFTSCAPNVESSDSTTTSATSSATTSATTTTTTASTTTSTPEPVESQPNTEVTTTTSSETEKLPTEEQNPVEEEIVPLEISPQSIPEDSLPGFSEFSAISTLSTSIGISMDYDTVLTIWDKDNVSRIDNNPNPNTTMVAEWGCLPNALMENVGNSYTYKDVIVLTNLTGFTAAELYKLIDTGTPIMIWVTEELQEGELIAEAEGIKMYDPHETVILLGYSDTSVVVWSPFQDDYVTYDRALFEQRFEELGSFALTITNK